MDPTQETTRGCGSCTAKTRSSQAGALATSATSVGAAVLAVIPSFSCPVCITAYAGVLSAAGFGFLLNEAVLGPIVAVGLGLNLAALAWTARSHRAKGPLLLGLLASVAVAAGRFLFDLPPLLYIGAAGLFAAALWNLWLKRPGAIGSRVG